MNFITVDEHNIKEEHICCAISDKKGENCVGSKKAWLSERFKEGLVFRKLDARGKVFIEYIPSEKAWYPIMAEGYMHINCFWVSGQFKGQGYANELLAYCIEDAKQKGKCGVTIISSKKKRGYLSDPDYMKYKGFLIADEVPNDFILYYLPFTEEAPMPKFANYVKTGKIEEMGIVLYYTRQCPHTDKYVPILKECAAKHGQNLTIYEITTTAEAQTAPTPFTTYTLFYNGQFITNEIMSEKRFEKFLSSQGLI